LKSLELGLGAEGFWSELGLGFGFERDGEYWYERDFGDSVGKNSKGVG